MSFDRSAFVRPIAHRGLHQFEAGLIENTWPAFEAAIAKGLGLECDLQSAADGTPMVFHDATLDRLIEGSGPIASYRASELGKLVYKGHSTKIIQLRDLLDAVAGRVPLLIEIKSAWGRQGPGFLETIAAQMSRYPGPAALMSFDPDVMVAIRALAPNVPRGLVAGLASGEFPPDATQAIRHDLGHLLTSGPVAPSFIAYHVGSLPTSLTRYVREVQGLPLFAWTVRSSADQAVAQTYADAPIFEGPLSSKTYAG